MKWPIFTTSLLGKTPSEGFFLGLTAGFMVSSFILNAFLWYFYPPQLGCSAMLLRPANESDLPFLYYLDSMAFPLSEPDTEEQWATHLPDTTVLVHMCQRVGFSVVCGSHLYSLAVLDSHRGKGFGSLLLAHAIGKGATSLFVRESNFAAQRLYNNFGFVSDRSDSNLLSEGLITMSLLTT